MISCRPAHVPDVLDSCINVLDVPPSLPGDLSQPCHLADLWCTGPYQRSQPNTGRSAVLLSGLRSCSVSCVYIYVCVCICIYYHTSHGKILSAGTETLPGGQGITLAIVMELCRFGNLFKLIELARRVSRLPEAVRSGTVPPSTPEEVRLKVRALLVITR